MPSSNHIALNLVTKGIFDTVALTTKGMIVLLFEIVFKKRGGSPARAPLQFQKEEEMYQELFKYPEEEIDYIKVYVDWSKKKSTKIVEASLIQKKIEAQILEKTGKNIKVELTKKPD